MAVSAATFVYTPRTTISHIQPSEGPINGGTKLTVIGSGFTAPTNPSLVEKKSNNGSEHINHLIKCRFAGVAIVPAIVSDGDDGFRDWRDQV